MDTYVMKKQRSAAYRYSFTRLALNYYTYYETVADAASLPASLTKFNQELNQIMDRFFRGEQPILELDSLRNQVMHDVEIIAAYADCFENYEYVINRMERKFQTIKSPIVSEEEITLQLMQFLNDSSEKSLVNSRIQMVIGQLPVRFTKQKFFGLVLEGLSVYIGTSRKNLEDILYMMRTEAMVLLPEGMETDNLELFELLKQFQTLDYKTITASQHQEAVQKIDYVSNILSDQSSLYLMLQDVINDLYVLMLAKEDAVVNVGEETLFTNIVTGILNKFLAGENSMIEDGITDQLTLLEGKQETYYEAYLRLELPEENSDTQKDPAMAVAFQIDKLLSDSAFVSLENQSFEDVPVDRAWLEQAAQSFFKELEQLFESVSRPVMRAVMAKVLSGLPVFFQSIDEIEAYIKGSLASCMDLFEKETCIELLEELMVDEYGMV